MHTIEEVVEILNDQGCMSSSFLMRKYRIDRPEARHILQTILDDFSNIEEDCLDRICIKEEKEETKSPRKSRWKDVAKPCG